MKKLKELIKEAIVQDKSNGDICFYKPEDLAKPDTRSLIKDLNTKLASNTPPERCYELKTEKNGNKILPVGCQFCIHKFECYADVNKGKGLKYLNILIRMYSWQM